MGGGSWTQGSNRKVGNRPTLWSSTRNRTLDDCRGASVMTMSSPRCRHVESEPEDGASQKSHVVLKSTATASERLTLEGHLVRAQRLDEETPAASSILSMLSLSLGHSAVYSERERDDPACRKDFSTHSRSVGTSMYPSPKGTHSVAKVTPPAETGAFRKWQ